MMAGDTTVDASRVELDVVGPAPVGREGAARSEAAPRRLGGRVVRVAGKDESPTRVVHRAARHGGHQARRIRVQRASEEVR